MPDLYVRTRRRKPGSDPDGNDRVPGPWHIQLPDGWQTWCGRRPSRIVSAVYTMQPEDGDKMCRECVTAREEDQPRSARRR